MRRRAAAEFIIYSTLVCIHDKLRRGAVCQGGKLNALGAIANRYRPIKVTTDTKSSTNNAMGLFVMGKCFSLLRIDMDS